MDSGERTRDERQHQEELLALAHDTELEVLARDYDDQLKALIKEHLREQSALRERSALALARLVAHFEKRKAASIGRFQVKRQMLRTLGPAVPMVVGKA